MNKTKEEMYEAIMAECKALVGNDWEFIGDVLTIQEAGKDGASDGFWINNYKIREDSSLGAVTIAYRMMGLETRDAVAAKDAEIADLELEISAMRLNSTSSGDILRQYHEVKKTEGELRKIIAAERARSAKLVEALEEIVRNNRTYDWPHWDASDIMEDIDDMTTSLEMALEAHKKGGQHEH